MDQYFNIFLLTIKVLKYILYQKMSVPVPLSSLGHAPLQVSRSVPAYPRHSPGCPAHSDGHHQVSGHRKLARTSVVSPEEMQRLQRVRRERARSASALRPDLQQHGAKRRKQDHNRWQHAERRIFVGHKGWHLQNITGTFTMTNETVSACHPQRQILKITFTKK